jgi:two-component system NtrC family sensor kinase
LELIRDFIAEMEVVWQMYDLADLTPDSATTIETIKRRTDYDQHRLQLPKMVKVAIEGNRRIRQIIADLRAFSSDIDRQEVPSEKLITGLRATVELVKSLFKGRITIETTLGGIPKLDVHANQINQVISNLLINAAQATPGEGIIRLGVSVTGDELMLTVADDGPGIPEAVLSKIFDPFFTTKPIGEGMGLGLSICYALVNANGGRIEVDADDTPGPKSGATFRVYLPIVRVHPPQAESLSERTADA